MILKKSGWEIALGALKIVPPKNWASAETSKTKKEIWLNNKIIVGGNNNTVLPEIETNTAAMKVPIATRRDPVIEKLSREKDEETKVIEIPTKHVEIRANFITDIFWRNRR